MGFVELEYHEAAYFITKAANNLTLTAKKDRGLIIDFAIEDHRTLLKRKQRYEKRIQKQAEEKAEDNKRKQEQRQKKRKEALAQQEGETAKKGVSIEEMKSVDELKEEFRKTRSRGKKQRIKKRIAVLLGNPTP